MGNGKRKTKPLGKSLPLTVEQVGAITTILSGSRDEKDIRDLALFRIGIDTMLRVSDLVAMKVGDVRDTLGDIKTEFVLRQTKTKKTVRCDLSDATRKAIAKYLDNRVVGPNASLFDITDRQIQRIVKRLMLLIRVAPERYTPHSWRRTKASIIYKSTGNAEAVRQLLGHASIDATSEYLDVSSNDAMELSRQFQL